MWTGSSDRSEMKCSCDGYRATDEGINREFVRGEREREISTFKATGPSMTDEQLAATVGQQDGKPIKWTCGRDMANHVLS